MEEMIRFFETEVAGKTAGKRLTIVVFVLLFFGILTAIVTFV